MKKKLITGFQILVLKWVNGARFNKAPIVDINYLYGLQIVTVVYFNNICKWGIVTNYNNN